MGESQTSARRRRSIVAGAVAALAVTGLVATAAVPAQAVVTTQGQTFASASHYPLPIEPTQLLSSKDGSTILAATDSPRILEIDPATKSVRRTIVLPAKVSHLTRTASGMVDAVDLDGDTSPTPPAVYELDPATGSVVRTMSLPAGFRTSGFALTPDGATGVLTEDTTDPSTATRALEAVVVHPATGEVATPAFIDGWFDTVHIGITPDGSKLFALDVDASGKRYAGALETLDIASGSSSPSVPLTGSVPSDVVVSPDGARVFVVDELGPNHRSSVDVIDVASNSIVTTVVSPQPSTSLDSLQLTADGKAVVAAGYGETLAIDTTTLASRELPPGGERSRSVMVPGTSRILTTAPPSPVASHIQIIEADAATGTRPRSAVLGPDYDPSRAVVLPGDHDLYYATTSAAGRPELAHFDLAAGSNSVYQDRFDDRDQYSTDVDVVDRADPNFSPGPTVGYIISGEASGEDLSAAAAAAHQHAEVVLTARAGLPAAIRQFEENHSLKVLFIVGSENSVSLAVRNQLAYLTRHHTIIVRIAGGDHLATSRAVVRQAFGPTLKHVWITSGSGTSDAFAASSAAAHKGEPVLAVNGTAGALDATTATFLRNEKATSFTIVGSTGAVSAGVASSLAKIAPVTRIAGADPVQTSQLVNAAVFPKVVSRAVFVPAASWQDQVLGVQLAAVQGAPLYFLPQNCVPDAVAERIGTNYGDTVDLIGTTALLSAEVADDATC